jgi:hypothetical protein
MKGNMESMEPTDSHCGQESLNMEILELRLLEAFARQRVRENIASGKDLD